VRDAGQVRKVTYGEVLRVPEFRALLSAQLLSAAGDQLARVALTVLVYDRTRSALLAAVTFVMGVVPVFLGGVFLSGLADRLPRRTVMIGCDLIRLALVLAMTLPGVPLAGLVALLFAVTTLSAPFSAARAATYPQVLTGERYTAGTAVTLTAVQLAQVIGFAAGGVVVGFFGVRTSLFADAATFAASALLVRVGVTSRPAAGPAGERQPGPLAGLLAGVRLVFGNPALRIPMLFGWLSALYNAPEGVATPLARALDGRPGSAGLPITAGLLLAAPALGYTLGALAFGRLASPSHRRWLMGPLATATCALLVLIGLRPGLPVTLVILAASGACGCFQVAANSGFVAAAPEQQRSQAFGLAAAGMSLGQGAAMILAGAAVRYVSPAAVIAGAGVLGTAAALALSAGRAARSPARPGVTQAPGS
jgi:predicted MFS family arabinose efflux permease